MFSRGLYHQEWPCRLHKPNFSRACQEVHASQEVHAFQKVRAFQKATASLKPLKRCWLLLENTVLT
jgi:hypothetical protein